MQEFKILKNSHKKNFKICVKFMKIIVKNFNKFLILFRRFLLTKMKIFYKIETITRGVKRCIWDLPYINLGV